MLLHSLAFLAAARHTVLFHKPAGVVTTHADELGRPTVYDALRAALPAPLSALAWHACGRLDQNTSGLLVLTTDGGLVHHVTHPSASSPRARGGGGATVEKEYRALCMGALQHADTTCNRWAREKMLDIVRVLFECTDDPARFADDNELCTSVVNIAQDPATTLHVTAAACELLNAFAHVVVF